MENNSIINKLLDEILLNETQKVSAATEATELFGLWFWWEQFILGWEKIFLID